VSDVAAGFALALIVAVTVGLGGYVILRRIFERASHRVADDIGRILAELSGRAAATPAGQFAGAAARAAAGHYTNMGAYATTQGMSEEAARREFADSIERLARLMDSAVKIPIIGPVGFDALLGLFPVAGDMTSAGVSIMLIARSLKYGIPRELIARMLANVLVDLLMGSIPVVGDLADIWFRANARNVALLREYLGDEARPPIEITATRVS
jgi:hypothetical protein